MWITFLIDNFLCLKLRSLDKPKYILFVYVVNIAYLCISYLTFLTIIKLNNMTTLIEIYKGIEIRHESDKQDSHPFVTVQFVPVIGALQTGHKTLKGAKQYIDKL